jgi:hypothetical protein
MKGGRYYSVGDIGVIKDMYLELYDSFVLKNLWFPCINIFMVFCRILTLDI